MECVSCSHRFATEALDAACERCGGAVILSEECRPTTREELDGLPPGVWRYLAFLPEIAEENLVTLGEGGTPLLPAERLGVELGLRNLMIKDESRNPTGSFMDRGSTVLLSLARERGVKECTCVTTGNLGASLAAYCAKANIRARIAVHQNADQGKLFQMLAYGADLAPSLYHPKPAGRESSVLAVNAGNPYLLEGEKTTGFELVQDLGWKTPDVVVVPVGTGGHLLMVWRSILQLREAGLLDAATCRLLGVQVEGGQSRPGLRGREPLRERGAALAELEDSEPFFRKRASAAIADSRGTTLRITSGQTIAATGLLARTEGIFAEPSSASVIAALTTAIEAGTVGRDETVVCIITGAGLKDPKAVSRLARETRRLPLGELYARPSPQIGDTKFALLRLLHGRPTYGYELRRQLGPMRRMSTASVYQHLTELEDFGMVRRKGASVSKGRERITYELTSKGNDYLKIAGRLERAGRAQP